MKVARLIVIHVLCCCAVLVLQDRKPGPPHVPMSPDEAQREQMMASMKAAGLGGQMYSRDDIASQLENLKEMGEDGDIPKTPLHEVKDEAAEPSGEGLQAQVAKARETVQEVVGQAKDAAAAVVDKAGSFLKGSLGKLSSSFKQSTGSSDDEEL